MKYLGALIGIAGCAFGVVTQEYQLATHIVVIAIFIMTMAILDAIEEKK